MLVSHVCRRVRAAQTCYLLALRWQPLKAAAHGAQQAPPQGTSAVPSVARGAKGAVLHGGDGSGDARVDAEDLGQRVKLDKAVPGEVAPVEHAVVPCTRPTSELLRSFLQGGTVMHLPYGRHVQLQMFQASHPQHWVFKDIQH